jgi:predicted dehydrogenase
LLKSLKAVAIGAGYFSQFHFDAWNRIPQVDLVAICDLDSQRTGQACAEFGIAGAYTDLEEMLDREQPDFVDIITRPETHLDLCRQIVARGLPIICQKPLAVDYALSRQIVELAAAANVPLMVHDNFRFQPWYREIKRLLEKGIVGKRLHTLSIHTRMGDGWQTDAYLARQPYFRTMPRLLIYETGVHFIDTLRFLGGEIDGVYACLRKMNEDIAGEDSALVQFEFVSGALGLWDADRYHEPRGGNPRYTFGETLIETDGGSIRLALDGTLTVQPLGESPRVHAYEHSTQGFAGDCVLATQQHFVERLLAGESFETDGIEYLKTLRVQEAIYESAELRSPVRGLASGHSERGQS